MDTEITTNQENDTLVTQTQNFEDKDNHLWAHECNLIAEEHYNMERKARSQELYGVLDQED